MSHDDARGIGVSRQFEQPVRNRSAPRHGERASLTAARRGPSGALSGQLREKLSLLLIEPGEATSGLGGSRPGQRLAEQGDIVDRLED